MVSDVYVHLFRTYSDAQYDNLRDLARYLILNGERIEAGGGLMFDPGQMLFLDYAPQEVAARPPAAMPPLAHGPLAGIAPEAGEDWEDYCDRAFGVRTSPPDPLCMWLQSPLWARTEPSAEGAGLRIVYVLDYGVPHDYIEIAMGQAHADYDSPGGPRWDVMGILLPREMDGDETADTPPLRKWPAWIGAVELNRRRAAITVNAKNLRETLIARGIAQAQDIAGLSEEDIRALEFSTGPMPQSYRQVLCVIGLRAGRLVDDRELQIHADQLQEVNRMGRERRAEWDEDGGDPVPDDAIFIGARYGMSPWFILSEPRAYHPREDSPVFLFDTDTGKVTQVSISVWGWVEGLIRDAETFIAEGILERNARRGHPAQLPPSAAREAECGNGRRAAPPERLRLAPEYRCSPLWDDECGNMLDVAGLGLSTGLADRILAWDAAFQATRREDDPVDPFLLFPDVAAERAWAREGKAIAEDLGREWAGPLNVQISALDMLVRDARHDLSPWTPTPDERAAWIGERCGVAEIEAAITRLDELSRERDGLPEWDGDSQDDIARAQSMFRHVLAHVPPRYIDDVAAGLESPEWGTRAYVAGALAAHERDMALPLLRNALATEDDAVVRRILARTIETLDAPSTRKEER